MLPLRLLAAAVLGVPIVGVIVFEVIFAFANFCEHGNIDLPLKVERALGCVFITPASIAGITVASRGCSTRTTGRSSRSGIGCSGPTARTGRT